MEYDLTAKERMIAELSLIAESASSNVPKNGELSISETTDEAKIVTDR